MLSLFGVARAPPQAPAARFSGAFGEPLVKGVEPPFIGAPVVLEEVPRGYYDPPLPVRPAAFITAGGRVVLRGGGSPTRPVSGRSYATSPRRSPAAPRRTSCLTHARLATAPRRAHACPSAIAAETAIAGRRVALLLHRALHLAPGPNRTVASVNSEVRLVLSQLGKAWKSSPFTTAPYRRHLRPYRQPTGPTDGHARAGMRIARRAASRRT